MTPNEVRLEPFPRRVYNPCYGKKPRSFPASGQGGDQWAMRLKRLVPKAPVRG